MLNRKSRTLSPENHFVLKLEFRHEFRRFLHQIRNFRGFGEEVKEEIHLELGKISNSTRYFCDLEKFWTLEYVWNHILLFEKQLLFATSAEFVAPNRPRRVELDTISKLNLDLQISVLIFANLMFSLSDAVGDPRLMKESYKSLRAVQIKGEASRLLLPNLNFSWLSSIFPNFAVTFLSFFFILNFSSITSNGYFPENIQFLEWWRHQQGKQGLLSFDGPSSSLPFTLLHFLLFLFHFFEWIPSIMQV